MIKETRAHRDTGNFVYLTVKESFKTRPSRCHFCTATILKSGSFSKGIISIILGTIKGIIIFSNILRIRNKRKMAARILNTWASNKIIVFLLWVRVRVRVIGVGLKIRNRLKDLQLIICNTYIRDTSFRQSLLKSKTTIHLRCNPIYVIMGHTKCFK